MGFEDRMATNHTYLNGKGIPILYGHAFKRSSTNTLNGVRARLQSYGGAALSDEMGNEGLRRDDK